MGIVKNVTVKRREYGFAAAEIVQKDVRRLTMRMTDAGTLRITAPWDAGDEEIDAFVKGHRRWIANRLAERASDRCEIRFGDGDSMAVFGKILPIAYETARHFTIRTDGVRIVAKLQADANDAERLRAMESLKELLYKELLREKIAERLPVWEHETGLKAKGVSVRTMRTRWGSCTPSTGEIRINTALAALPVEYLDCVLAHELTHLKHRNHDAAFYAFLDRYFKERARVEKYLKHTVPATKR